MDPDTDTGTETVVRRYRQRPDDADAKNATLPSLERGRTSFSSREKHGLSDAVTMRWTNIKF